MFYKICCSILWFVTRIAFRFKVVGKENIPTDIGFILCSNHISAYDPIFIAIDLKKQVHYMAKEELFENPFFRFFGNGVGAFSVKRGTGDANALQTAIDYVKKGEVLGIFPEGTRSKDGKPLRPKSGAAYVAKETGAAVLPVTVCCEGGKVKMFRKVTVVYGKLIPAKELGFTEEGSAKELRNASRLIMDRIIEGLGENA